VPIDVRGRDVSVVERNVAVTKVVGEEDQDVGSVRLSLNRAGRQDKSEDQHSQGSATLKQIMAAKAGVWGFRFFQGVFLILPVPQLLRR
jgi:hypothetical protein